MFFAIAKKNCKPAFKIKAEQVVLLKRKMYVMACINIAYCNVKSDKFLEI